MKDNNPTVFCAYCGAEIKNEHGFSLYGYVGYHSPCPYDENFEKMKEELKSLSSASKDESTTHTRARKD